jgi:hypothetical protein
MKTDASAPEIPFLEIIDQEIAGFPPDVQNILEEITTIIRTASTNRPGNHQVSLPDKSR